MSDKKTFKEIHGKTKLGLWLKEKAPSLLGTVLNVAGNLIPGGDAFKSVVGGLIGESKEVTPQDREHALKLLDYKIVDEQEKTKRWESDAHSDSWLSKNVRPIIVLYLIFCTSVLIICDSIDNSFKVAEHWVTLLTSLLIVAVGGYFSLREFGKFASKKYK